MSSQPQTPGPIAFGGPFSPALAGLRSELNRETTKCWLLVALATLCILPLSRLLFALVLQVVPALLFSQSAGSSSVPLTGVTLLTTVGAGIVSVLGSLLVPVLAVVWAVVLNRRVYKLTVRDLVWGGTALCLVEETFSHIVEEAKSQRYRPNPSPVKPGHSLVDRLNHFAYHYRQYYQLSYGPSELQVPLTIQDNCWIEGIAMVLSCCLSIVGVGLLLFIPLFLRCILVWPRIIAIKQAVIDYLAGKFDADLQLMVEQRGQASSG